jgi:enoyl-CoA hydratase
MREDRMSVLEQDGLEEEAAIVNELRHGRVTLASPDLGDGVSRFAAGAGRHGSF